MVTTVYGDVNAAADNNYEVRIAVTYDPASKTASQVVALQMQLRKTNSTYKRQRHNWELHYYVDNPNTPKHSVPLVLPDDNAAAGVVAAGHLTMVKNQWYNWGPAYSYSVKNDGNAHRFDVSFGVGTVPRSGASARFVTFPKQEVKVDPPKGIKINFNSNTRVLSYTWDDAACSYIKLWSSWYSKDGTPLKEAYIDGATGTDHKLYNKDKPITETLPKNVAYVTYKVVNVSTSGYEASSGELRYDLPTEGKIWVKVNGVWKKATPWVKVNGVWKKAVKTYVNVNGTWKPTTT